MASLLNNTVNKLIILTRKPTVSKLAKNILPVFLILIIVGILFFPYFKKNLAPVAIDIPVGMYYPWYNNTYGYAVRPLVKNSLISDTVSQFWVWRNRAVSDLVKGRINIWNPYSFSGYEMSPWFHTILFSPLNIFYFFAPQVDAMSLIVVSQVLISLLGCYLLGALLFSSVLAGMFFAISWTMSSFFVGWLTWGTLSFALALIPWTLYFYERYLNRENPKLSYSLTTLTIIALILSGHPQTISYSLLIFFLWGVVRSLSSGKKFLKSFISTISPIILGLLLCAPVILPSITIIKNSIRSLESLSSINYGFIPWSKLIATLMSVNYFGNPSSGNYFGGDYNFQEKLVNFGTIALFFAVYRIVKIIKKKKATSIDLLGLGFILLGFLLVTAYPIGFLVYRLNLPLLSTSPAGRATILIIFGGIILACEGFKDLEKGRLDWLSLIHSAIYFLTFYLASYIVLYCSLHYINTTPTTILTNLLPIKANYITTARNTIFPLAFFIALITSLIIQNKYQKLKVFVCIFITIMVFLEGFLFFRKITPFVPKNLYFPDTPSLSFLKEKYLSSSDLFRVERESGELLPPNMWEAYNFYSVSGYDPIAPYFYEKYLIGNDVKNNYSRYFETGDSIDKMEILGIRYFLALKRNNESIPDEKGQLSYKINIKKWTPVFSEGPVVVLENKSFKPPYFLENFSFGDTIKLVDKKSDLWEFNITTSKNQSFMLMENNSQNWKAYLDDSKIEIKNYQNTFKQVEIPKGEHKLLFVYKNQEIINGLKISVGVLFICFLIFVLIP